MEGKQNLDIKLNFDKPTFYIGELLTGHIILYTEKSSVIEKIDILQISEKESKKLQKDFINKQKKEILKNQMKNK